MPVLSSNQLPQPPASLSTVILPKAPTTTAAGVVTNAAPAAEGSIVLSIPTKGLVSLDIEALNLALAPLIGCQ